MKTYIRICITYYGNIVKPSVYYYRKAGSAPAFSSVNKLTIAEANQLMWELVKLGGENSYSSNRFDSAICYREVAYYGET